MAADSTATLVIGYGSPIRGDDALGPLVADRLEAEGVPAGVTVVARHVLTAELVADLAAVRRVIFIDAAVDSPPGAIRCQPLAPDPQALSTMAHFLDPRELLAWCETLYGKAPEAYLLSAGVASLDYANYQLTPPVEESVAGLLDAARALVDQTAPTALPAS